MPQSLTARMRIVAAGVGLPPLFGLVASLNKAQAAKSPGMNQSHGASLFKRESPFSAWPSSKGGGSSPGWSPPVNRSSPATMRATLLPGRTSASGAGSCPITVPGWLSDGRRATRPARWSRLSTLDGILDVRLHVFLLDPSLTTRTLDFGQVDAKFTRQATDRR